jgi:hypothetical protein
MSDYVKSTNFYAKDALVSGDPNKIIKGAEIDVEFNNIATSVTSKADTNSPTFSGVPTAPTAALNTNTTQLATTAFVKNATDTLATGGTLTNTTLTNATISSLAVDLSVADGGTGKGSLALNNVLLGNGTSAVQEVAPGTSGNLLTSNGTTWQSVAAPSSGIGYGQTWQDVTGSRALGTTYTNSTGKPIFVSILVTFSNGSSATLVVNGVTASIANNFAGGGDSAEAIIPPAATYSISGPYASLASWSELR